MLKDWLTVLNDFIDIVKSTAPLLITLVALKLLLRSQFTNIKGFSVGMLFVLFGLFLFQKGVNMCMLPLADDVGTSLNKIPYRGIIILVSFILGFTATLVEPALKTLSLQVEEITVGVIQSKILIYGTAIGVAGGMALGILKVLYKIKTAHIVIPCMLIILVSCIILMSMDKDFIIALAFDCAGATTGPVNIPINAAIAIGLAVALKMDPMHVAFGLVGLTSLGTVMSLTAFGILFR